MDDLLNRNRSKLPPQPPQLPADPHVFFDMEGTGWKWCLRCGCLLRGGRLFAPSDRYTSEADVPPETPVKTTTCPAGGMAEWRGKAELRQQLLETTLAQLGEWRALAESRADEVRRAWNSQERLQKERDDAMRLAAEFRRRLFLEGAAAPAPQSERERQVQKRIEQNERLREAFESYSRGDWLDTRDELIHDLSVAMLGSG